MRRRYISRRLYADPGQPPEPYQPTPEEVERSRKEHAQLALDHAEYMRKLHAGEVQPHQVMEQNRGNE